jgi:hypothetical protein
LLYLFIYLFIFKNPDATALATKDPAFARQLFDSLVATYRTAHTDPRTIVATLINNHSSILFPTLVRPLLEVRQSLFLPSVQMLCGTDFCDALCIPLLVDCV